MTRRLYYTAPTLDTFEAHIVARRITERGVAVQLDQTAFYPTSGGQPHDRGTIAGIPVVDVWEEEDGTIWHLLTALPDADVVTGTVDRSRRFDHMQQHTGQHLLSAAFVTVLHAQTIGFHLGSDASTIDLDCPHLTWEAAFQVEDEVNRVIWENRPVTIHIVPPAEIDRIPLRKPPQVTGEIRVIWVEGYDASACGGTHVQSTGEVGLVKITGIERYKGGTRVTFLCGARALRNYRRALHLLRETAQALSLGQDEVPQAVMRLQDELQSTRRALNKAQTQLLEFEADHLWEATPEVNGVRRIIAHWNDRSVAEVRLMANRLRERPRTLLLLAVGEDKGVRLIIARSEDLPQYDAAALLRQVTGVLGGRGGGSPALAQGGTELQPHEVILEALRQVGGA